MTIAEGLSSRGDRFFAALAIIGLGIVATLTIALHILPTGYDPVTQAVSDYAIGNYSLLMMVGFLAGGIGNMSLARTLSRLKEGSSLHKSGTALLLIAGLALFILGFFPTDVEGGSVTTHGIVHGIVSQIVFITWPLGMLVISYKFGRRRFLLSFFMLVGAGTIFAMDKVLSLNIDGPSERFFISVLLGWSLLVSSRAIRDYFFA